MFYTLFHYNTYRFLKDDIARNKIKSDSTFMPAFVAGVVAITASHPFEVLRSQISLNKTHEGAFGIAKRYVRMLGFRGLFVGFVPRLVRKPINSGICWTIL